MKLAWGARLTPEQRSFVVSMAQALGTDPSWLTSVIKFESNWDPAAVNPATGASGLIQFMPATAVDMGTTVEQIRTEGIDAQLPRCFQYWKPYAGRMPTLSDTYMAVLYPKAIGLPEEATIFPPGSKAYLQNRGLDIDHDGDVSKVEAAGFVQRAYIEGLREGNVAEIDDATVPATGGATPTPEGGSMASTTEAVGSIVGLFNPLVGGLITNLGPLLQGKLNKALGKAASPDEAAAIAANLSTVLLGQAKALTGKQDDFGAITAIVGDPAQAENKAKLEAALDAELDKMVDRMSKAGDKMTQWDQAMWNAQIVGRQTVSSIAIEERKAGLWDMTRTLVLSGEAQVWALIVGALSSMVYCLYLDKVETALAIFTFVGTLGGWVMKRTSQPVDYRFDGTKEQSQQSQAMAQALAKK